MFPDSLIDRDTLQAYRETHYHVHGTAPMRLEIGITSPELADLHAAHRVSSSAFITACNPFSQTLADAANTERQLALASDLRQRNLSFIDGVGQHPSNAWPAEASFLILGVSRDEASELGVRHRQNAIVWCGLDAVPQLVLLR